MVDILVVEDHEELANLTCSFLRKDGYEVEWKNTGEDAIAFLANERVKLVLLDLMLPGIDGFAVCNEIRKVQNVPIVIISAKNEKEDQLNAYALGADDYIEKPVDIDLLRVKIGAIMKRNYQAEQVKEFIESGAITIDLAAKKVFYHGKDIAVTVKEFELLQLFVQNPGKTLHKDYLFQQIWGMDSFSENQTLTVHVKMLRDKFEDNPKKPERIQTVWGVGYRYEEV